MALIMSQRNKQYQEKTKLININKYFDKYFKIVIDYCKI